MSNRTISTTAQNAARLAELSDKLEGYPSRGVHAGGGVHVTMPATWDGTGAAPSGWSSYRAAVSGGNFGAATGQNWLRANGPPEALTSGERTELIGLLTPARRFGARFNVRFW